MGEASHRLPLGGAASRRTRAPGFRAPAQGVAEAVASGGGT